MEVDPMPFPDNTVRLQGHRDIIRRVVLLPDGERIVTASWDRTVRIYSLSSASCLQTLRGHRRWVIDVTVIDGDTIASLSNGGELRIWSLSNASLLGTANLGRDVLLCSSLGDGYLVLALLTGGIAKLHWDGTEVRTERIIDDGHDRTIRNIAVHDGCFVTACSDESAKVWDADTFECLTSLTGHTSEVYSAAMGEDHIVTGSFQELRVYDASSFDFVRDIEAHNGYVNAVQFVENADIVVSCGSSDDMTIAAHSISSGCCLWRIEAGICPTCVEILPKGIIAIAGSEPFDIRLIPGPVQMVTDRPEEIVEQESRWPRPVHEVFLSHAGPDKFPFAIPLYDALTERNITVFLDREELKPGDDAAQRMIDAMETSPILVVITSPEYCARKWTIKELSCGLRRDKEAREKAEKNGETGLSFPRPGEKGRPIIIPVFYRLNLQQCKNLNFVTDVSDVDERNLRRYHEMLNRMDPDLLVMRECMAALGGWTGIENDLSVTNEDTAEMRGLRDELIGRVAGAVEKAVQVARAFAA